MEGAVLFADIPAILWSLGVRDAWSGQRSRRADALHTSVKECPNFSETATVRTAFLTWAANVQESATHAQLHTAIAHCDRQRYP
jgi:hypothetical protein